jgi:hypothetical protein
LYGRCIVWLTQLTGDGLGRDDVPGAIKYKDGLRELSPLFEPHVILLTELLTAMNPEGLVKHTRALLPACLPLRVSILTVEMHASGGHMTRNVSTA